MPSEDELKHYYASIYSEEYAADQLATRHQQDLPEAQVRADRVRPLAEGASLLEVGSGSGAFLEAVQPSVSRVVGIEPDLRALEWHRTCGLTTFSRLEEVGPQKFDVIVMFHVLEHIPDPVAFLRGLIRYLQPGGRILVEVPNVDDALVSVYRVKSYLPFYYQKAHLLYFSAHTLDEVLQRAGLHAEIDGVQRYGLGNHLRWMLTDGAGDQSRYAEAITPSLEDAYARSLIERSCSDTLWAVARPAAPSASA